MTINYTLEHSLGRLGRTVGAGDDNHVHTLEGLVAGHTAQVHILHASHIAGIDALNTGDRVTVLVYLRMPVMVTVPVPLMFSPYSFVMSSEVSPAASPAVEM